LLLLNIVNYNTPANEGWDAVYEDPSKNKGINQLYYIWSNGVIVAGPGAGLGTSGSSYKSNDLRIKQFERTATGSTFGHIPMPFSKHFLNNISPEAAKNKPRMKQVEKKFRNLGKEHKRSFFKSFKKWFKKFFRRRRARF
jgi:hypothetical protein